MSKRVMVQLNNTNQVNWQDDAENVVRAPKKGQEKIESQSPDQFSSLPVKQKVVTTDFTHRFQAQPKPPTVKQTLAGKCATKPYLYTKSDLFLPIEIASRICSSTEQQWLTIHPGHFGHVQDLQLTDKNMFVDSVKEALTTALTEYYQVEISKSAEQEIINLAADLYAYFIIQTQSTHEFELNDLNHTTFVGRLQDILGGQFRLSGKLVMSQRKQVVDSHEAFYQEKFEHKAASENQEKNNHELKFQPSLQTKLNAKTPKSILSAGAVSLQGTVKFSSDTTTVEKNEQSSTTKVQENLTIKDTLVVNDYKALLGIELTLYQDQGTGISGLFKADKVLAMGALQSGVIYYRSQRS